MSNLKSKIESILFVASRPVRLAELIKATNATKEEIKNTIQQIGSDFEKFGINLIEKEEKYLFVSNPDNSKIISDFLSDELREKLTDAALETLAIILYKQPISRAEIEAIRGVNSQYMLRHLLIRGLIEKSTSPEDARRLIYKTTLEFMTHIGIRDMKELPDFEELTKNVSLPQIDYAALRQNSVKDGGGIPEQNIGKNDSADESEKEMDDEDEEGLKND